MKAYCGDTRSKKLLAKLCANDIGQCIIRGKRSGRRLDSFFYDNGAFVDWRKGESFDSMRFERDLRAMRFTGERPDFIVLPDVVAGGMASLRFSLDWLSDVLFTDATYFDGEESGMVYYLAVQDGMTPADIPDSVWPHIGGLFVGGTVEWKEETMSQWAELAHANGVKCHVGRVGTARRVAMAKAAGVDSIDSCLPMWSDENFSKFTTALAA